MALIKDALQAADILLGKPVERTVERAKSSIWSWLEAVTDTVESGIQAWVNLAKSGLEAWSEFIQDTVDTGKKVIEGWFEPIKQSIETGFNTAVEGTKDFIKAIPWEVVDDFNKYKLIGKTALNLWERYIDNKTQDVLSDIKSRSDRATSDLDKYIYKRTGLDLFDSPEERDAAWIKYTTWKDLGLREDDDKLYKEWQEVSASDMGSGIGLWLWKTIKDFVMDDDLEKYLTNWMSSTEFNKRYAELNAKATNVYNQREELMKNPKYSAYTSFLETATQEYRNFNALQWDAQIDQAKLDEYIGQKIKTLSRSQLATIGEAETRFVKDAQEFNAELKIRQKDINDFLSSSISSWDKSWLALLQDIQKKQQDSFNEKAYLKVLGNQMNASRTDLEKDLMKQSVALKDYKSFQEYNENVDAGAETLAATKWYIAQIGLLELPEDQKKQAIAKLYEMYDMERKFISDYIIKAWSREMQEKYPRSKYNRSDYNKLIADATFESLSPQDQKRWQETRILKSNIETEVNRIQAKDTDKIAPLRWLNAIGAVGSFINTKLAESQDRDSFTSIAPEVVAWVFNTAWRLITPGKDAMEPSEFEKIAIKEWYQKWQAFLDRSFRSEIGPLLRAGTNWIQTTQELISANSDTLLTVIGTANIPSIAARATLGWVKIWSKIVWSTLNNVVEWSKFIERLAPVSWATTKFKNVVSTALEWKIGFDRVAVPAIIKSASGKKGKWAEYVVELWSKSKSIISSAAWSRVAQYADDVIKSATSTAITDPFFNVMSGDAPTSAIQTFNAFTGMFFDVSPLLIHDGWKRAFKWSFVEWGRNMFTETGRALNDSMNNIMFGFMAGDTKQAVKDLQQAYKNQLGINIDYADWVRVLNAWEKLFNDLYNPEVVKNILNNKWELHQLLAKNIPQMNAKNMSTLLTGDGIGIRINDSSIRVAEQLDRLKGLYSFISLAGNTIDAKAMKLEASWILDSLERFVTGKGRLDDAFIAKEFRTEENIARNKKLFDQYKQKIITAKNEWDLEDAIDDMDGYIYKVQSKQGSTKRNHMITLVDGKNPRNKEAHINITVDDLAELSEKNIADLIKEWKVTIWSNEMGIKEWEYLVSNSQIADQVWRVIQNSFNNSKVAKDLVSWFIEKLNAGKYPNIDISEDEIKKSVFYIISWRKSKVIFDGADEDFVQDFQDLILDIAKEIYKDVHIEKVDLPRLDLEGLDLNNPPTAITMTKWSEIISAMKETEADLVVAAGTYIDTRQLKWEDWKPIVWSSEKILKTWVYLSIWKNIISNETISKHIETIIEDSKWNLAIYAERTREVMDNIFTLGIDNKIDISIEKWARLLESLYDSVGNAKLNSREIIKDIIAITKNQKAAQFIVDLFTKANVIDQAQAGLLAINLAYTYKSNEKLITELVDRASKSWEVDKFNAIFAKILLGNIEEVYKKVFNKWYNAQKPSKEILDKYHEARAAYISRYENQKLIFIDEIEQLKKDKKATKSLVLRESLDRTIKENEKRIKNIDKLLSKINTFKKDFMKDLATKWVMDKLNTYAKSLSFNFLYRKSDDLIDQKFIQNLTDPEIKFDVNDASIEQEIFVPSIKVTDYEWRWTRKEVENNPDKIYLFGDNRLVDKHFPDSTQAVIRWLPNAVWIYTKKKGTRWADAFFSDWDFDMFKKQVDEAIDTAIDLANKSWKEIVIPKLGLWEVKLDKKAPKLYAYLQEKLNEIRSLSEIKFDVSESNVDLLLSEPTVIKPEVTEDAIMRDLFTEMIANVEKIKTQAEKSRLYDYMIKFTESPSLGTKMDIQKKANEWYTNRINGFIKNGKPNSAKPFKDIQDMMNTMMNELYTREAKINNLDSLVDNVYNASVPAYSQSYLKNNPLILMSLKKAFTMSGAGDDRVAMALRKSLGIPDSVDSQDAFVKFLNSSDGTELREKFDSLFATNDKSNIVEPNIDWLKKTIFKATKDINIDTFNGSKRETITNQLVKEFINSNGLADLIKTMKSLSRMKKYDNVYDAGGKKIDTHIEPILKIDRMIDSGMDVKFHQADSLPFAQLEKITPSVKNWYYSMIWFGDKDTYLQWYKPAIDMTWVKWKMEDAFQIVQDLYVLEYSYAEKFFIGKYPPKKDLFDRIKSIDTNKSAKEFQAEIEKIKKDMWVRTLDYTDISKREASQMSNFNVFDKIDIPVNVYVFVEKQAKDIPKIDIANDGTFTSSIALTKDQSRYIQEAINSAYTDGILDYDKAVANKDHYIQTVFNKTFEDGYSVMTNTMMNTRDKVSAYHKWRDETKDHLLGYVKNADADEFAVMGKTNFNKGTIAVRDEKTGKLTHESYAIGLGIESMKMGKKNMIPYSKSIPNYKKWDGPKVIINDIEYELAYPPFKMSTQDFKNASSDTSRKKESASTGASIIAKLPYELAREIALYQDKLIKDAWDNTIGNLLSWSVEVTGFSDVLKAMQKIREYTGQIGDGHSSIIQSKLDAFMSEMNDIITKTRVDSWSAVIRKADNTILTDSEILLSKDHPVVRKAFEKIDSFIQSETSRREELGLDPLTNEDIQRFRDEQLVTTMHRFPTPSMYNLGIYKIKILEEELAGPNAKMFEEYKQMWGNQVVMTSVPAYLKMEGDFDGDKVFFVPLSSEVGQVFGKALMDTNDIPATSNVAREALDRIESGDYYNKYVITEQVDSPKLVETKTKSWVIENPLFNLRRAAMIGKKAVSQVSATYRTLALMQQEKEFILRQNPNAFDNVQEGNTYMYALSRINMRNRKDLDAKMMSFLQVTLDFAKTGQTQFSFDKLKEIKREAFNLDKDSKSIDKIINDISVNWGNTFPLDKYAISLHKWEVISNAIEVNRPWIAFRMIKLLKHTFGTYISILWDNNEKKVLKATLARNNYFDLENVFTPFVYNKDGINISMLNANAIKKTIVGLDYENLPKENIDKFLYKMMDGSIYGKALQNFNTALLAKIYSGTLDGEILSPEKQKFFKWVIQEMRWQLMGYVEKLIYARINGKSIKEIKYERDMSKFQPNFEMTPHDKLIMGTIAWAYGERYMMDYYTGNDLIRYITDTHSKWVGDITETIKHMYNAGMIDESRFNTAIKSLSFSTLLPDELKLLKEAKTASLNNNQDALNALLSNNSEAALNPADIKALKSAISDDTKDLKELEDMSSVLQLKEKAIKNDDPELLSLYQSIVTKIDSWVDVSSAINQSEIDATFEKEMIELNQLDQTGTPTIQEINTQAEDIARMNTSDTTTNILDEIVNDFQWVNKSDYEFHIEKPKFVPKEENLKLMVTLDKKEWQELVDDMLKEAWYIDEIYTEWVNLTMSRWFAKYLPEFFGTYESVRTTLNRTADITVANEFSIREFSNEIGSKNLFRHLKDAWMPDSQLMNYIEAIQSALLRKEEWVYKPRELWVALEQLLKEAEKKWSEVARLTSLLTNDKFIERLKLYQKNVIEPVANSLNEIQRKYFDPAGDTFRWGNSIGAMYEWDPKLKDKIVEDVLQAHKWDTQLARVMHGYYTETDVEKAIRDKSKSLGDNGKVWIGTVRAMKAVFFAPKFWKTVNTILWALGLMQSFAYTTKYGLVSVATGNGFISGVSQLLPNYVELRAYKNAYGKDLAFGYQLMDEFGLLSSESVIRFGTGNLKDLNEGRLSRETGSAIKKIGSLSAQAVLWIVDQASKLVWSKYAKSINNGEVANEAGDVLHMVLTNPLGASDLPLEAMRKAVAITATLKKMGIKNMSQFNKAYDLGWQTFLNKVEYLASTQFANSGGGVVSASAIQRQNIVDQAWHYLPESIQPAGYIITKAMNFLMGWANYKAANAIENSSQFVVGLNKLRQGKWKEWFAHIQAGMDFFHMVMSQTLMMAGLYMQSQKREKDPEDLQTFWEFFWDFSNLGVVYEMLIGKWIDMDKMIDELDPNASLEDQAGWYMFQLIKQQTRVFNVDVVAKAYEHYKAQLALVNEEDRDSVNIIDSILWAFNDSYATTSRIINAKLSDSFYQSINQSNTVMLLSEGQWKQDKIANMITEKSYMKYERDGFWKSVTDLAGSYIGINESGYPIDGLKDSIVNDLMSITTADKDLQKLYNGWQISGMPWDYNLSTLVGNVGDKIDDRTKKNIDDVFNSIKYDGYFDTDAKWNRINTSGKYEDSKDFLVNKEFERYVAQHGLNMEAIIKASPYTPEVVRMQQQIQADLNISTPVYLAWKAYKEFELAKADFKKNNKKLLKKGTTWYEEISPEQELELKRWIILKNQVSMNLSIPLVQRISELHINDKHSDVIKRLDGLMRQNEKHPAVKDFIGLVNTHQLISRNVAEWDTNVTQLNSKMALAMRWLPDTQLAADLVIQKIKDVENLPIDPKRKLATQASIIYGLNKSQLGLLENNAEFEKLSKPAQKTLVNWMYKINSDVLDFDSNSIGKKLNESAYWYNGSKSKYAKSFAKTPFKKSWAGSDYWVGGPRPNFSKQFDNLNDYMQWKEWLLSPRYREILNGEQNGYNQWLSGYPSQWSKYRAAFYRYIVQTTFYGYDSKWSLSPFIERPQLKWPIIKDLRLKKKQKPKKDFK